MIIHFTKNELNGTFNTIDYIHRLIEKGKLKKDNMPPSLILERQFGLSEMVDTLVIVKRLLTKLKEDFT